MSFLFNDFTLVGAQGNPLFHLYAFLTKKRLNYKIIRKNVTFLLFVTDKCVCKELSFFQKL